MMLYQGNVVFNVFLLVLSVTLLAKYINNNALSFLPWTSHGCNKECLEIYFAGPPNSRDLALIELVQEKYLLPPPYRPETGYFDINKPVWARLVDWNLMQHKLLQIWEGKSPGVFVEVGAADGEFMSQTLMLERNLSWTGLLVEPDPRSYAILQQRRRNAWTSPLCIHLSPPSSRRYWLRRLEEDLPEHFQQLLMARSKLNDETLTGDEERGVTVMVPCLPLSTLLTAANITTIDLLNVFTGTKGDETRITDVLRNRKFNVKTLLVHYTMGTLLTNPYPSVTGYILDLEHSTLLVKLYVNKTHCKLLSNTECKKVNHHDTMKSCHKYQCFDFLTVWTVELQRNPPSAS